MSNLQTYNQFKLDYQKAAKTFSCKTWNSPVEYTGRECKHDIKESKENMFNPIFKENIQGGNIQGVVHWYYRFIILC